MFWKANTLILEIDTAAFACPDVPIPPVWTIRQKIDAPVLVDIESAARTAAVGLIAGASLRPGATVAVGVGSRGINSLVIVVRAVIAELKLAGLSPFIVPAMGSHGGATAGGQEAILRDYGITESMVGAPVRATMEVRQVSELDDGYPVYFDCNALEADAVVVINRIKHHTDFKGPIESGLGKMCAIGLGKQKGAATIHRFGADGLRRIVPAVARKLVENVNILGGIGLIENQYGLTAEIHAVPAAGIAASQERDLLDRARQLVPRLPFDKLDVLIVDEMGKNISGSGMDTHVIGRLRMPSTPETEWDGPDVRVLCVLDLTDESHGNAAGLGLADMATRQLIEKVDFGVTMVNHRTSGEGGVQRGRLPLILEDAYSCVQAAVGLCGQGRYEQVRLARIRNTEFVETIQVSRALLDEIGSRNDLEVLSGPSVMDFGKHVWADQ